MTIHLQHIVCNSSMQFIQKCQVNILILYSYATLFSHKRILEHRFILCIALYHWPYTLE